MPGREGKEHARIFGRFLEPDGPNSDDVVGGSGRFEPCTSKRRRSSLLFGRVCVGVSAMCVFFFSSAAARAPFAFWVSFFNTLAPLRRCLFVRLLVWFVLPRMRERRWTFP